MGKNEPAKYLQNLAKLIILPILLILTLRRFVKTVVRLRPEKSASVMDVAEIFVGLRTDIRSTRNDHEADLEELQQTEVVL